MCTENLELYFLTFKPFFTFLHLLFLHTHTFMIYCCTRSHETIFFLVNYFYLVIVIILFRRLDNLTPIQCPSGSLFPSSTSILYHFLYQGIIGCSPVKYVVILETHTAEQQAENLFEICVVWFLLKH